MNCNDVAQGYQSVENSGKVRVDELARWLSLLGLIARQLVDLRNMMLALSTVKQARLGCHARAETT